MVDWSKFDGLPKPTVFCLCGEEYRSHAKYVMEPPPHMESQDPCPKCGKNDYIRKVSHDPEKYTIR